MEEESESKKIYRWRWVGDILVQVFGKGPVDHADWDSFITEFRQRRAETKGTLVVTLGAGPSGSQRASLRSVLDQGPPLPTAILHGSRLSHGIASAIALLLPPEARPRGFAQDQLGDAFEYLQVPPESQNGCRNAVAEMERELGISVVIKTAETRRASGE
jgi:hypothetical protein